MGDRVLVTGAGGFLGRHVVARARARKIDAVASRGDLRDPAVAQQVFSEARPSAVIHLAAGARAAADADDEVRMALNVAAAAGRATVLAAGSAAQYGMGSTEPISEESPLAPLTHYGEVKCAVERALFEHGSDARVIAARCFNVVGPGQDLDAPIPSWAAQLADGATVLRTGNLGVVRDFLDVRDVADAFLDLVTSEFAGVVNVGSGEPVTLRRVVDELIALVGQDVEVELDPALIRESDPPSVVADTTRLRMATGFAPGVSLRQSLADVWTQWRDRGALGAS
jgi:GDP-4-dehydro-6-deoxy-D-mannose reductase